MACPHKNIQFCPLYVANHMANGHGCDDGSLGEGECGVARGQSYERSVAALSAVEPRLVAELRFSEEADESRKQRARNMALNRIH